MEKSRNLRSFTLASVSLLAMSAGAFAQTTGAPGETTETVVVTGSRVITDIANSPTPVTTVSTAQLLDTTPSNLSDALNKLPDFIGGGIRILPHGNLDKFRRTSFEDPAKGQLGAGRSGDGERRGCHQACRANQ